MLVLAATHFVIDGYGNIFTPSVIPRGSYPGQDRDNHGFAFWNAVIATDRMPDDLAYAIAKVIIERKPDLVAVHKEAEAFSMENQVQDRSPIPFHPGALKYLKEKGVGG